MNIYQALPLLHQPIMDTQEGIAEAGSIRLAFTLCFENFIRANSQPVNRRILLRDNQLKAWDLLLK